MTKIIAGCLLAFCVLGSCDTASPPVPTDPNDLLITNFTSADWGEVSRAKRELESRQAQAIPSLLKVLDREEKVELLGTADLIYPGAKKFYGHGGVIDYELDWLAARAGWALEELTFQNFGFEDRHANKTSRAEAISRAKSWWQVEGASWNRFDAILDALRSEDPERQVDALGFLASGNTNCDGLTEESFRNQLLPEIEKLSKSKDEFVPKIAKGLLEKKDRWWLDYKRRLEEEDPDEHRPRAALVRPVC